VLTEDFYCYHKKKDRIERRIGLMRLAITRLKSFCVLFAVLLTSSAFCASYSSADLERAIRSNDLVGVKKVLKYGDGELQRNIALSADYFLQKAARFGSGEMVKLFLSRIDSQNLKREASKALVVSIDNDHFHEVVPVLLKSGADANYEFRGMTAFCRMGYLYAGKKDKSAKTLATMRLLLDKGAAINTFGEDGRTCLMSACEANDLAMVEFLIARGANAYLQNKDAQTAFDLVKPGSKIENSLKKSRKQSSAFDFDQVADPFAEEEKERKLMELSYAVSSGDADTVKALLSEGISADSEIGNSGITLLMQAKNAQIAKLLLDAGADVNRRDKSGRSVLHHIANREADSLMVALLLRAGANVNLKDNSGETPLKAAGLLFTEKISPEWGKTIVPLFVNAGADINAADNMGYSLLHQAASNDNAELASICLMMGANPDLRTSLGQTPKELARSLNSTKFLKTLNN
jgi:ankyrin repeat protein